jgi:hypothetical protein
MGLLAAAQRDRAIVLDHPRNLLRPIATGSDPDGIYPRFVFRLLTLPEEDGGATPREELKARLDAILYDAVDTEERLRAAELVYGAGGVYDRPLLDAREMMLDEVERTTGAFSRELEALSSYLRSTFGE